MVGEAMEDGRHGSVLLKGRIAVGGWVVRLPPGACKRYQKPMPARNAGATGHGRETTAVGRG